ncbi:hypothetical protein ACHAXT_012660 [Thalassiosira profunda]
MRAARNVLLAGALATCLLGTPLASAAESTQLDDKMLAMAKRLVEKVAEREDPPPSWKAARQVMEHSFLGGAPLNDNEKEQYQSAPREEEGRRWALHWLAHEDISEMSQKDYEAGLLQRYALAAIYFATHGDAWTRCARKAPSGPASGCETEEERYLSPNNHKQWDGVHVEGGQVTWLDLSGRGIESETFLPLELTLLSPSLELLWVSENEQLEGSLPEYLGEFRKLKSFSAYKTSLSGPVPESLYDLPKLESIRLYKSKFNGSISPKVGNVKKLKWFWIHGNQFTGTLPDELGKLENLEGITLHGNKFAPIATKSVENPKKKDWSGGLASNIVPDAVCELTVHDNLDHLWTDCEDGSLATVVGEEGGTKKEFAIKEGAKACSCCTRCFPRNDGTAVAES